LVVLRRAMAAGIWEPLMALKVCIVLSFEIVHGP
jgi:hypothetical protein